MEMVEIRNTAVGKWLKTTIRHLQIRLLAPTWRCNPSETCIFYRAIPSDLFQVSDKSTGSVGRSIHDQQFPALEHQPLLPFPAVTTEKTTRD
jgi:hypothetical protein